MSVKTQIRMDRHGWYAVPIWVGTLFTGVWIMFTPQVERGIPDWFENLAGFLFAAASVACLIGTTIPSWRLAYKIEFAGMAVICVILGLLAFVTELSLVQMFTMKGGLGALIQIGSIRAIVELVLALRDDKPTSRTVLDDGE